MPVSAIVLWLITGGLGFVVGTYLLWRVERLGVRRWGACGRIFGLGDSADKDREVHRGGA